MLVFATGYGTRVAVLSLVTIWTNEDVRARTFAIAQLVEIVGRICADPLLLKFFAISLQDKGFWSGLPFFIAAVSIANDS